MVRAASSTKYGTQGQPSQNGELSIRGGGGCSSWGSRLSPCLLDLRRLDPRSPGGCPAVIQRLFGSVP